MLRMHIGFKIRAAERGLRTVAARRFVVVADEAAEEAEPTECETLGG